MIDEQKDILLDVSVDNDATETFQVPDWAVFIGVMVPDLATDATITIEISVDEGTTYVPVIDLTDGNDLTMVASTYDPCYVDISDHLRALPAKALIRFAMSAAQGTDKTFTLCFRG